MRRLRPPPCQARRARRNPDLEPIRLTDEERVSRTPQFAVRVAVEMADVVLDMVAAGVSDEGELAATRRIAAGVLASARRSRAAADAAGGNRALQADPVAAARDQALRDRRSLAVDRAAAALRRILPRAERMLAEVEARMNAAGMDREWRPRYTWVDYSGRLRLRGSDGVHNVPPAGIETLALLADVVRRASRSLQAAAHEAEAREESHRRRLEQVEAARVAARERIEAQRRAAEDLDRALRSRPLPALPARATSHEEAEAEAIGRKAEKILADAPYLAMLARDPPARQGLQRRLGSALDLPGITSMQRGAVYEVLDHLTGAGITSGRTREEREEQEDVARWNLGQWLPIGLRSGLIGIRQLQQAQQSPDTLRSLIADAAAIAAIERAIRRGDRKAAVRHAAFVVSDRSHEWDWPEWEREKKARQWLASIGLEEQEVRREMYRIRRVRNERAARRLVPPSASRLSFPDRPGHFEVPRLGGIRTTFGVENELDGLAPAELREGIRENLKTRIRFGRWSIVLDASVPGGAEIVSPILHWPAGAPSLAAVIAATRQIPAGPCGECGLHVHVGAGKLSRRVLTSLLVLTWYWTPVLRALTSTTSARTEWARQIPFDVVRAMAEAILDEDLWWHAWYGLDPGQPLPPADEKYDSTKTRYRLLNLHSLRHRGTVEFRSADATTDPQRALDLVALYLAMVRWAIKHPLPWKERTPLTGPLDLLTRYDRVGAASLRTAIDPDHKALLFLGALGLPAECRERLLAFIPGRARSNPSRGRRERAPRPPRRRIHRGAR
jgi:hypothetical protein